MDHFLEFFINEIMRTKLKDANKRTLYYNK